jgi:hypothetical protein
MTYSRPDLTLWTPTGGYSYSGPPSGMVWNLWVPLASVDAGKHPCLSTRRPLVSTPNLPQDKRANAPRISNKAGLQTRLV